VNRCWPDLVTLHRRAGRAERRSAPHVCAPIDPNGNLASDGLTSYTWNARDQLTGLSGGTSASFSYDGFGRRQSKTISGTSTNFLYDGLTFVQELSAGGTPTANLLTGMSIDEVFHRTDSGGARGPLIDALGSWRRRSESRPVRRSESDPV
jgi:YD repeat-containing protein